MKEILCFFMIKIQAIKILCQIKRRLSIIKYNNHIIENFFEKSVILYKNQVIID